jgi:UMF1 family MFS transporter
MLNPEGKIMKSKMNALEWKWIAYDVGNSAFILLVTTILPIYFNSICKAQGIAEADYLSYWSYATSVATIVVAAAGPVLGTVADYEGNKNKIYLACAGLGALALASFWIPSSWFGFLLLYIAAKICYSLSLVVYDSMLVDVTTEERMDAVSANGYAWGYIGSVIPFLIALVFVLGYSFLGITLNTAMITAFVLTAAWWIVFSLPLAFSYKQTHSVKKEAHVVRNSFSRLKETLSHVRRQPKVFLFLLAFFFYIDGVYTIIDMATAYGTSLGLNTTGLLLALLLTQVVAFPASLTFSALSRKKDTAFLIEICIFAYFCIVAFAIFLQYEWQFWVLAAAVGCFQGGIQSMSRSYYAKIIPQDRSGEYFGLFDICGKGASFLGLLIVGGVTQLTGHQNIGVACITVLFLIGYLLFRKVSRMA